jgi:hypothetical protein
MLKWNRGGNTPTLNMKKFLITKDTIAHGKKVFAGDVVELTEQTGHELCSYNKAEIYVEKPKQKKEDRSVGLETSKVKAPKTRAKK